MYGLTLDTYVNKLTVQRHSREKGGLSDRELLFLFVVYMYLSNIFKNSFFIVVYLNVQSKLNVWFYFELASDKRKKINKHELGICK